jgi:polyisoprenoid-binding protein YceI
VKLLLYISIFISYSLAISQETYVTTNGHINFNASTPFEDIDANNKQVNAILKTENGHFASVLLLKDFTFRKKLMQEHFNENYVESDKYPKATFSGIIQGFTVNNLTSNKTYTIKGKLTLHGVTKEVSTKAVMVKQGETISLKTSFIVKPEDYNIRVPKIVFKKIAKEVKVSVNFALEAKKSR